MDENWFHQSVQCSQCMASGDVFIASFQPLVMVHPMLPLHFFSDHQDMRMCQANNGIQIFNTFRKLLHLQALNRLDEWQVRKTTQLPISPPFNNQQSCHPKGKFEKIANSDGRRFIVTSYWKTERSPFNTIQSPSQSVPPLYVDIEFTHAAKIVTNGFFRLQNFRPPKKTRKKCCFQPNGSTGLSTNPPTGKVTGLSKPSQSAGKVKHPHHSTTHKLFAPQHKLGIGKGSFCQQGWSNRKCFRGKKNICLLSLFPNFVRGLRTLNIPFLPFNLDLFSLVSLNLKYIT